MKATHLLRTLIIGLVGFLCCTVLIGAQWVHADVPLPQVIGPIPVIGDSHPFSSASHTNTPLDLSRFGYVEEEYFVRGYANVYNFNIFGMVIVKTANAPYTTRVLVRRPVSRSEFSGTVIVELLNPTPGFDQDVLWQFCHDYFLAHGDAWVGITSKPVAVQALKNFDRERYAPLSWDNPLPLAQTCADPYSPSYAPGDSTRATENGLVWDIMSQVGALLKKSHLLPGNHPLQGFRVERVFGTGYSQTGGFLVTYINFIRPHPNAHLDDGTPVYDGYLIGDGDGMAAPLNQCAEPFEPGEERMKIQPRPEPVISVVTQSLVDGWSILMRRADSDSPDDRYRRYEVPGATHITQRRRDFSPSGEDMSRLGLGGPPTFNCTGVDQYGLTDFPLEYILNGAFANLDAWVQNPQGNTPPEADWITMDNTGYGIVLDQYGNATGGVRTPYLDVPIATYFAPNPEIGESQTCGLLGYKVPLDCTVLLDINCICFAGFCFSCNRYVPKVEDVVEELVDAGFITVDDGERIISEAEATQPQLPYRRLQCITPIPFPREPGP